MNLFSKASRMARKLHFLRVTRSQNAICPYGYRGGRLHFIVKLRHKNIRAWPQF